jgi:hypothetical protein
LGGWSIHVKLGKKLGRLYFNQKLDMVACVYYPSESRKRKIGAVQASPGKKQDPISKIIRAKRAAGMGSSNRVQSTEFKL